MAINLEELSREELKKLLKDVEKAIKSVGKRELAAARNAAEKAVAEFGYTLDQISGGKLPRGAGKGPKAKAKYRNPNNPEQTWSGRGRKPAWIHQAIADGIDVTALEI